MPVIEFYVSDAEYDAVRVVAVARKCSNSRAVRYILLGAEDAAVIKKQERQRL